jgi:hypothetical protein
LNKTIMSNVNLVEQFNPLIRIDRSEERPCLVYEFR